MITTSSYSKSILCVVSSRFFLKHIEIIHHFFIILSAPSLSFALFPFLCWRYFRLAYDRSPCALLPSECFSKEVADTAVHFPTPGWLESLMGCVSCLPTRRTMWYVFWLLVFILLSGCILTFCGEAEYPAPVATWTFKSTWIIISIINITVVVLLLLVVVLLIILAIFAFYFNTFIVGFAR